MKCACGREFFPRKKRKYNDVCGRCAVSRSITGRSPANKSKFDPNNIVVDKINFVVIDINGVSASGKKFQIECERCKKQYTASLCFEPTKKYPWHCKSCAISREWNENKEYHETHVKTMLEAASTDEHKQKISALSKRNWATPDIRAAMCDRDWTTISQMGHETMRKRALSGERTYKQPHGKRHWYEKEQKRISFRSSYELRFAIVLDNANFSNWVYEPRWYSVCDDTKTYLPDFEIPGLGLVEVKGYWREDAHEKFESFCLQQNRPMIVLVMKRELELLEKQEVSIEDLFSKTGR